MAHGLSWAGLAQGIFVYWIIFCNSITMIPNAADEVRNDPSTPSLKEWPPKGEASPSGEKIRGQTLSRKRAD